LRYRAAKIGLVLCAVGLAAAGCKNSAQLFQDNNEGGWFSKRVDIFDKPSWAKATGEDQQNVQLNPRGPVDANELVSADGRCGEPVTAVAPAAPAAPAAAPAAPADRPVGTVAGDLAITPMPAATPVAVNPEAVPPAQPAGGSLTMGGIALGMTECEVVRRAGLPGSVNITASDKGERRVVLTYLTGNWPGIYAFESGRLKIVDAAPAPPTPVKPVKKQRAKKPVKPKTATRDIEREYVQ